MKYLAICMLFVAASVTAVAQSAFRDDFNGPALDPAWTVITYTGPFPRVFGYTTPANTMSLTARPGYLRYSLEPMTYEAGFVNAYRTTQPGEASCCPMDPSLELQHKFTGDHWLLETKLDSYMPYTNGRGFRLQVYFGDGGPGTYVVPLWRQRDVNQNWHGVLFLRSGAHLVDGVRVHPDAYADLPVNDGPNASAWFRLRRDGGLLTASISFDGSTWNVLESVDMGTALDGLEQRLSLTGGSWFNTAGSYADWDYVSLQPAGTPPSITCPSDIVASADEGSCGTNVPFDVVATGSPAPTMTCSRASNEFFPVGTTAVTCTASNGIAPDASCAFHVTVKPAPFVMSAVTASPANLWPPNRAMVAVALQYITSGGCGSASCSITNITSDQPGRGDPTSPDWEVIDAHHLKLRAESIGRDWRVYTITLQCHDESGQSQTRTVKVGVGK
jgi:hypothetical protein